MDGGSLSVSLHARVRGAVAQAAQPASLKVLSLNLGPRVLRHGHQSKSFTTAGLPSLQAGSPEACAAAEASSVKGSMGRGAQGCSALAPCIESRGWKAHSGGKKNLKTIFLKALSFRLQNAAWSSQPAS
mmetsp:Transcript_43617/g.138895  ORF Transcript_43617/g.138895 Transcript_43617/m.138895 type:complete len:129 (+) Transcript_43617:666-1052(+)